MSGLRDMVAAVGCRGGGAVTILNHLAAQGPSSAQDISAVSAYTRVGARARLVDLHAAGVIELEHPDFRAMLGESRNRYYADPDALRYLARWLDAIADRAEQANRAAAFAPMAGGRTR